MEDLKESINLIDWWLKGCSPALYTRRSSAGLQFDLDRFLDWQEGQIPLLRDTADFYAEAIREISRQKSVGLLAFIHSRSEFDRMGIVPLAGMISTHSPLGIPYLIVKLGELHPIEIGEEQCEAYLREAHVVMITDQVNHGYDILDAARILKLYGAEEVSSAVSLVAERDGVDLLKLQGIDLIFSQEMRVEGLELKFNPNQQLLALAT